MTSVSGEEKWVLPHYPLIPDEVIILDWGKFISEGCGDQRSVDLLKKSFISYFSVLIDPLKSGKALAPTTTNRAFLDHRMIAQWMANSGIWSLRDLKVSHVINFLKSRKSRVENSRPSQRSIASWVQKFQKMWDLRDYYDNAIRFDIGCFEDEINIQVRGRSPIRWQALPDHVAFALIADALDWIEKFGAFQTEYLIAYIEHRKQIASFSNNERNKISKIFFSKIRNDNRFKLLDNSLNYSGKTHFVMMHAMAVLEGACLTLLFILVGMRVSEVMALNRDALTSDEMPGGYKYLCGPGAKKGGIIRRWVVGRPLVQVVELLVKIGDVVRNGGVSALFLSRNAKGAISNPLIKARRMQRTALVERLRCFAISGLRVNSIQAEKFHPHMGRKTFAQLAVRRDRSLLEPVSAHLGHVYQSFTDGAYVGQDHALAALLSEADRRELAASLEHLLSCGTIVGGGAAGLEEVRNDLKFKGKRALKSVVKALVGKGVKIAPCDWGFCMYNEAYSACGGDKVGPNEVKRSPDVCAGCKNFAVTERHRHWWEDRVKREANFLSQKGLPEQTVMLVNRRLARSKEVLKDIVWLQAPASNTEST